MNEDFLRSTLELNIKFFEAQVKAETEKYIKILNQLKDLPSENQEELLPIMTGNFPTFIELLKTLELSNRVALSRLGIDEIDGFDG
jgi:hypothetical protein